MIWILAATLSITVVELFVRLPFSGALDQVGAISRKALHIVGAKSISDHWKEKALLAYSASLFASTVRLVGLLAIVGAFASLMVLLFVHLGYAFETFIVSRPGIIFYCTVATIYFTLRKVLVRYRIRSS